MGLHEPCPLAVSPCAVYRNDKSRNYLHNREIPLLPDYESVTNGRQKCVYLKFCFWDILKA